MRYSTNDSKTFENRKTFGNDWQFPFLTALVDFLYPTKCLVCKKDAKQESDFKHLCKTCTPQIRRRTFCQSCGTWDTTLIEEIATCYFCLQNPFSARYIRSCIDYDEDAAQNLIKALKYKNKFLLASILGKIMADNIDLFPKQNWDIVLALPSHKQALISRGFSHMHLVTKEFCRLSGFKSSAYAITNKSQKGYQSLSKLEGRYSHMKGAFCARKPLLKHKSILLLDDVITTGASVESATKALLYSGANTVDILSFARSSKFSKNRQLKPIENLDVD